MVSIKDVAQSAGVSVTTVSHVINATRFVAPATKIKVEQAIQDLGYQPSSLARALKINATKSIGMLVSSSTNPFFAEVVRGVEEGCFQKGYSLILCNSGDKHERHLAYLQTLMQKRIDALVVMTTSKDQIFNEKLASLEALPKILLDAEPSLEGCAIGDDSLAGGRLATNYLLGSGHREIACLTGPHDHPRSSNRYRGYIEAMKEAGLVVKEKWVQAEELTVPGGYRAMCRVFDQGGRPQAVFACNDLMAFGAYRAISERGLAIPADISIIGYDNLELSTYLNPALTTIHQPSFDLGLTAADILIDHLENKTDLPNRIQLDSNLVERESVAKRS